jgi:hypothetical protein
MKKLIWLLSTLCLLILVSFLPINTSILFIKDKMGRVRLTRMERRSILGDNCTLFTYGENTNRLFKPDNYFQPKYIRIGPFDEGCFDLYVEFKDDTVILYPATAYQVKNLLPQMRIVNLPNSFGEVNLIKVSEDRSGKYLHIDCK